jgi:hypothetical protein
LGHNRQELHRNAPKGSGGVGIFVKNCLLELYDIKVIDRIIDGIIGIKLINKENYHEYIVYSCYMPPENSRRGRDSQTFFAHILSQIYANNECEN